VWVLLFLLTTLAWAQPVGAPKPVFPDDSRDPKQAGGAELLEAVCPGHVVVGKEVGCKIVCPEGSGFEGVAEGWILNRITRGHFLSPESEDAVLSMGGCESHPANFGGTILLTMRSEKWKMLWYKGGVPTEDCHRSKVPRGREILICQGGWGGQGNVSIELYVEDLLSPRGALMTDDSTTFFSIGDTMGTCGYDFENKSKPSPIQHGFVERVQFLNASDGALLGLSVFARRGERTLTVGQVQECIDEENPAKRHRGLNFNPHTKPYRVDFKFDGEHMVRVGSSPGAPK
jgi:hypothetical protein